MPFIKQGDPIDAHNLSELNEECSLLIGSFFHHQNGSLCFIATELEPRHESALYEVELDWRKVYAFEDRGTPIIGFYHTHPFQEHLSYSSTDEAIMKAWCAHFGRDMLYIIGNGKDLNTIYLFSKDGHKTVCPAYDLIFNTYQTQLATFLGFFTPEVEVLNVEPEEIKHATP